MIHQYILDGHHIVIDTCSASVHVVDEVAYDMIALFEQHTKEEVLSAIGEKYAGRDDITPADLEECYAQIEGLRDDGNLFVPDTFEPLAGTLKERGAGIGKALWLHVAHTCNLNCS